MAGVDENFPGLIRPTTTQGGMRAGGKKPGAAIGQNRRVLGDISKNIINRAPTYPYAVAKRGAGLTEKPAIPIKKPLVPVRRPITRTFAAQLASKQLPPLPEEKKPKLQKVNNENHSEDCSIIDDFNEPMFVQHTEAMMEEINKMDEEVEMEDVFEQPLLDIDSADKENPLAVVEYVDDIYAHYRKEERASCVSPAYMSHQSDITERMRSILIDWLIEVHYKFELLEETLYLTVNLIDRFLESQTVVRKKLQLVGVTAMLLACKYEEISVPVLEDFIIISDKAYTRKEVLDMEVAIVNTLQFNLSVPTPYVFTKRFLKAAQSHKQLELLTFFIIELCLVEYQMLKYPPSLLAAAAVFTAQCTLSRSKQWTQVSEMHSHYSEHQLSECAKMMVTLHQKAGIGKLLAVYKKYCTSKHGYAARAEPADFMLEPKFWN